MSEYVRKQALLDRINTIRNAHIEKRNEGDECDQFANEAVADWLWAIQEEIQSGAFDAQVFSTTNLYICPKCEVISDQNSWNMATRNIFGDDIGEIQTDEGDIFVCPSCKGKSDRTEINPIQSNNAGMEKGAEG